MARQQPDKTGPTWPPTQHARAFAVAIATEAPSHGETAVVWAA